MNNIAKITLRIINIFFIFLVANCVVLSHLYHFKVLIPVLALGFFLMNIYPSVFNFEIEQGRLRQAAQGDELLIIFFSATCLTVVYILPGFLGAYGITGFKIWLLHSAVAYFVLALVFWNGIIRVYITSVQLGLRYRILGIICGFIPILQLIALVMIIKVVKKEVEVEHAKNLLNDSRKELLYCRTKYPILLVHGVFFRDYNFHNYWGRIPEELTKNGATIFYGNQQSAASVEECGKELAQRIQQILSQTGCEKINIIAHSKGGLDSRYAISMAGAAPYVASLTTINTPHRGCEFAEYLLNEIPVSQQKIIATAYNRSLKKLGDSNPDFIKAVTDLTASACELSNKYVLDSAEVYYQSIGSVLNVSSGGRFPLNLTEKFVKKFDGPNDGLVGVKSFQWGENYRLIQQSGKRGISHGDVIDFNRENFEGFDVREFYVQLVHDLKEKGF